MRLQHIVDWTSGEAYFAITNGASVARSLKGCRNWTEARAEYKAFLAA